MYFIAILLFLENVEGFYKLGHTVIGRGVDLFLSKRAPEVKECIYQTLGGLDISEVSSWADSNEVRKNKAYRWSIDNHFLVTRDSPEKGYCDLSFDSTEERNLYKAMLNYTSRLSGNICGGASSFNEELKFLIHYSQDIFQPLHVSGSYRGGNDLDVIVGKRIISLHNLWDSYIPEYLLKTRFEKSNQKFSEYIARVALSQDFGYATDLVSIMKSMNKMNCDYVYNGLGVSGSISPDYLRNSSEILLVSMAKAVEFLGNLLINLK